MSDYQMYQSTIHIFCAQIVNVTTIINTVMKKVQQLSSSGATGGDGSDGEWEGELTGACSTYQIAMPQGIQ